MTRVIRMRENSGRPWSVGFTLMEVIVALAVIAVATTIGISMFTSSYALGDDVRYRRAAQRAAQEVLTDMQRDPASYKWPVATDQLQQVTKIDGSDAVGPPSVKATERAANTIIETRYDRLHWRGYARLPAPGAPTCELTVVVSWIRAQRTHSFTLTSLAPRNVLEGKS